MVGLVGLNKDFSGFLMATSDSTDNLGEELKSMFLRGKIGKAETSIGLNDPDGGK